MFELSTKGRGKRPFTILCLGAHADDIEIGCGGTLLRLIETYQNEIEIWWVVFSSEGLRHREAEESASRFLRGTSHKTIQIKRFRGSYFPYQGKAMKEGFEKIKRLCTPDIILTHYRHDLHQDHRVINELTWNTFRNHFILEYEIPKYDGDLGIPNFFVHLNETQCRTKAKILLQCFKTQRTKQWFTEDTFLSLARLRGIESNAPHKFAEAFYCRKMIY
jgi:LmbE family N-acetylglucosaminyl deacetylase